MKNRTLFLAVALVSVAFFSPVSFAGSTNPSPASATPKATVPVPLKMVHFSNLPRQYENVTIKLTLTIDEQGLPHNVQPAEPMPKDLAQRILPVIAQWRFKPSYVDGKPVVARVILPLELIEGA